MWSLLLILLGAGFFMLILEMFLPGMVMGVLGALSVIAGIFYAYIAFDFNVGNTVLVGAMLGSLVLFLVWMKIFPHSPVGKALTLKSSLGAGSAMANRSGLIGRRGKALSYLRPAGTAVFDQDRVDVVAETNLIEAGSEIEVVKVEGVRVVVRRIAPVEA
jgi:membrane-bound serine protease (ClpP class)